MKFTRFLIVASAVTISLAGVASAEEAIIANAKEANAATAAEMRVLTDAELDSMTAGSASVGAGLSGNAWTYGSYYLSDSPWYSSADINMEIYPEGPTSAWLYASASN